MVTDRERRLLKVAKKLQERVRELEEERNGKVITEAVDRLEAEILRSWRDDGQAGRH